MTRFLVLALLAFLLWLGLERGARKIGDALRGPLPGPRGVPDEPRASVETLERCPTCGSFFPGSRGVRSGERTFCSERCREAREGGPA